MVELNGGFKKSSFWLSLICLCTLPSSSMLVAYSITDALQSSAFLLVLLNTSVAFAHIHVQNMHRTFFWILWKSGWRYFSWRVLFLLIGSLFGNPYLWVTRSLPWWNHTCQYLAWFNKYETRIKHVPGFFIRTFAMILKRDGVEGNKVWKLHLFWISRLTFSATIVSDSCFDNFAKADWFFSLDIPLTGSLKVFGFL